MNCSTVFLLVLSLLLQLASTFNPVSPEYNKHVRPNEGKRPDEVKIGIFIDSAWTVSEADKIVVLYIYLQVRNNHPINSFNNYN